MKKIIIANDIRSLLEKERSFLNRSSVRVFAVNSNEDALDIHKTEKADLIVTNLDMLDMSGEMFCSIIRKNKELCKVSIIVICPSDKADIERISQCRANAFITMPVTPSILLEKSHQLLNIPKREYYRSPISIKVDGRYESKPFLCYSENISASGMLFITDRILLKDDTILCSFILPDSTHIITDAEVIRVDKKITEFDANQYGIKFLNLAAESRSAIEAFIRKNYRKK